MSEYRINQKTGLSRNWLYIYSPSILSIKHLIFLLLLSIDEHFEWLLDFTYVDIVLHEFYNKNNLVIERVYIDVKVCIWICVVLMRFVNGVDKLNCNFVIHALPIPPSVTYQSHLKCRWIEHIDIDCSTIFRKSLTGYQS